MPDLPGATDAPPTPPSIHPPPVPNGPLFDTSQPAPEDSGFNLAPPHTSFDANMPPPPRVRPTLPSLTPHQLAMLFTAAVLTNLALRSQVAVLSSTLAALLIAGPILGHRVRTSVMPASFGAGALLFSVWLSVRASTWLTWLNTVAVIGFLVCAAATTSPIRLRLATSTLAVLASRALQSRFFLTTLSVASAPMRSLPTARFLPVIRGLAIAAIPVAVLAALLASADAVFAESLSTDIDPSSWISHTLLTLVAAAAIAGLVAVLGVQPDEHFEDQRPLGSTEALVLLISVGVLYAGFALVQLSSALGRSDRILQEQGINFSDYARSGFFQLLWVAGLTVVLLTTVRMLVSNESSPVDRIVRIMGALVSLLTTLIVATAVVRLGLYTDEFGQTTLRWYCTAFAWMLGAAFALIAAGHFRRVEEALPTGLIALVAFTLLAVNILNPEARVAQHNLARADAIESLDADYLTRLSADAWPTLLTEHDLIAGQLPVGYSFDQRCMDAAEDRGYGLFGFNLAVARLGCP